MATLTETEAVGGMDLGDHLENAPAMKHGTELAVSKGGLYVLLKGMLDVRPLVDHALLHSHLHIRYGLQVERMCTDLIHASLRILHDAVEQKQPPRILATYRSFCLNTVPCLLRQYQVKAMRYQMHEGIGRAAISAVDQFNQARLIDQVGEDWLNESNKFGIDGAFLDSCRAVGVIQQQDELSFPGATGRKYGSAQQTVDQKAELTEASDADHVDGFAEQLSNARGDAEGLVRGLIKNFELCCEGNDTEQLAKICNVVLKDSNSMDLVALHCDVADLFKPLAQVLERQKPEDQTLGDHFALYEQFASIILFMQIFARRFSLTSNELHLDPAGVASLTIDKAGEIHDLDKLSSEESDALGAWLRCLLDGNGIDDDMYARYPPTLTHRLAATIFDQCRKACAAGVIEWEPVQETINYLLDTSLISAVVPILASFVPDIWRQGSDPNLQLKILTAIVDPSSLGSEIVHKHRLILELFSPSLMDALEQAPKPLDTSHLKELIQPLLAEAPRSFCDASSLGQICSTPEGGILKHISSVFQSLLNWAYDPDTMAKNPEYSFRHIIAACMLTGSTAVLDVLCNEILDAGSQIGSPLSAVAAEVVHVMICTPVLESFTRGTMTLKQALANRHLLYFGLDGFPEIDMSTYLPGGTEYTIDDLHKAVERSFMPVPAEPSPDAVHQDQMLQAQERAFSGMDEGLGLTGVPTDLAMDFGPQQADLSQTLGDSAAAIPANIDLGNIPLSFDLSMPLTNNADASSAQVTAPTNEAMGSMDLDQVMPYIDPNTTADALGTSNDNSELQPDPNFELAQLQALGNEFSFDTNTWDDFAGFDDTSLGQLGEAADNARSSNAGPGGMNAGDLDAMDFSFLETQAASQQDAIDGDHSVPGAKESENGNAGAPHEPAA